MKNTKKNFITKLIRKLLIKLRRRKLGNRLPKSRMIENTPKNNGKRKGENQGMKVITSSLLFILLFGCSDSVSTSEPVEPDVIRIELDPGLNTEFPLEQDGNGYYHLELSGGNPEYFESWQTIQRISGTAYINDIPLEVLRVHWESDLTWYLGDTLG